MITFEKTHIYGWEAAIRGMRNPMNSWDNSDTQFLYDGRYVKGLGEKDYTLMKKLADKGPVHGKFMRMITVTVDIVAPLYWWKEFDTYKVGTVRNSCSTMHKIAEKTFTLDDFSHEHLCESSRHIMLDIVDALNYWRKLYIDEPHPVYWWQMIQLLPSSYNQRSTVQMNYAVLQHIYPDRKNHKLDEWQDFCRWIRTLPNSGLITGE